MSALHVVRRRVDGQYAVDAWGHDADLVTTADPLLRARYRIEVMGTDRLESIGPLVVVANQHLGISEGTVVAEAVRRHVGAAVRAANLLDVPLLGSLQRRFGAVLPRRDEVTGLLREGGIVAVMAAPNPRNRLRAGRIDPSLMAAAVDLGAPVLPVAVLGSELGRSWRVWVGHRLASDRGRGPLAAVEVADDARRAVQDLLDAAEPLPSRWWAR